MDHLEGGVAEQAVAEAETGVGYVRRDGPLMRQIGRDYDLSRNTIRHVLKHPEPHPAPLTRNRAAKVLGPFQAIIDQILVDDDDAPPKQRHTAMQVFRRLRDEHGYPGC